MALGEGLVPTLGRSLCFAPYLVSTSGEVVQLAAPFHPRAGRPAAIARWIFPAVAKVRRSPSSLHTPERDLAPRRRTVKTAFRDPLSCGRVLHPEGARCGQRLPPFPTTKPMFIRPREAFLPWEGEAIEIESAEPTWEEISLGWRDAELTWERGALTVRQGVHHSEGERNGGGTMRPPPSGSGLRSPPRDGPETRNRRQVPWSVVRRWKDPHPPASPRSRASPLHPAVRGREPDG